MRAILGAFAITIALVGGVGPAPAAAAPDNTGPACTDIKGRDGIYNTSATTGNAMFIFSFTILEPPCRNTTYQLTVTDSNGGTVTATYPGALTLCDSTRFCFTRDYGPAASAPTTLFVTGSSSIGEHVADTTPTVVYVLNGGAGDNSWDQ